MTSNEHEYAQCIIMRVGLMSEAFQDVMVNVSMKARGGDGDLLKMKSNAIIEIMRSASCLP